MRFGGRRPRSGDTKRSEEKELASACEFGGKFASFRKKNSFAFPQNHFQISVGEGEELFGCIWYTISADMR